MKKLMACLMALALLIPGALAETLTLDGTVVSAETAAVLSPADGVLEEVYWLEGEHVEAGSKAASFYAAEVYANESGTVRVMGAAGDSLTALTARYGAVVYIEPDCQYTISCNTSNAYDAIANKILHPGEKLYIRCSSDGKHKGVGTVTAVSGSSFTVEVSSGEFEENEAVYLYRNSEYTQQSRVGRGNAAHASPVAYTGAEVGRVISVNVQNGSHVWAGTPLFTILQTAYPPEITSGVAGTVAAVRVAAGSMVTRGTVVADIYPDEAMRIEMMATENDLRDLHVGLRVSIEFTNGDLAEGEIDRISAIARQGAGMDSDEAYFAVYVRFGAQETVRYGMTAKVTTLEDEE